jgi:hypothetical protein
VLGGMWLLCLFHRRAIIGCCEDTVRRFAPEHMLWWFDRAPSTVRALRMVRVVPRQRMGVLLRELVSHGLRAEGGSIAK